MSHFTRRALPIARALGLWLGAAAAIGVFGKTVSAHYPIKEWMVWVYLEIWAYCALFVGACLSLGHLSLRALRLRGLGLGERFAFTVTAGVLAFFCLVFAGGLARVLGPVFAVAMPVISIAVGVPFIVRDARRPLRHVRALRARGVRPRSLLLTPILLFGAFGVFLVYYGILSPRNIAFDSHFYHLGVAQQYATEHAIRPFREGWLPGALPHLASVLYAWALVLPGLDMFSRLVCASHVEFVLFLWTLACIPVLVSILVAGAPRGPSSPRARASASWAALFLFPGILVYDSTLSTAADHVAAFWAVPAYLALRRAYRDLDPRAMVMLALALAGAILSKYQGMYLLAFPVLAILFRTAVLFAAPIWRRLRERESLDRRALLRPLWGLSVAALFGLLFTAPHWLKNWIFYGDPFFPYLNRYFHRADWVPGYGQLFADWGTAQTKAWVTSGTTFEKFQAAGAAMFTFSFEPHDWANFHGKVPVFGSLFTLSLGILPFVRGTRRVWALSAATHLGVFVWFWTMHQDRYLQLLLPWMAAVTAATITLAWRSGWVARVPIALLVALQIAWGGDAYLIPAHAFTKQSALAVTSDLLSQGYKKNYTTRLKPGGALFEIGADPALPADARVLLHENNPRLGIWRPIVNDTAGWQFALRYELCASPAALEEKWRALGVTHIVTRPKKSRGADSLGADLRFFDFITHDAVLLKRFGEYSLLAMPTSTPPARPAEQVLYLGCGPFYERGLHELGSLAVRDKQLGKKPPKRRALEKVGDEAALLARVDFAVVDPSCKPAVAKEALADFVDLGTRGKEQLWARKRAVDEPEAAAPSTEGPDDALDHLLRQ